MTFERGVEVTVPNPDRSRAGRTGSSAVESDPRQAEGVEVRIPAEAAQLSVMRAVVGDLAMRADFDVDSIADLRLAVDEACSTLIRLAAPEAKLLCRFRDLNWGLSIESEVASHEANGPRTDTFSWRVLSALIDSVDTSVTPADDDSAKHLVRIELLKRRVVHE